MRTPSDWQNSYLFPEIFERIKRAAFILYRAFHVCENVRWQQAVNLSDLKREGVGDSDIRWLIQNHYISHGKEIHLQDSEERVFKINPGNVLTDYSCFVLTESGRSYFSNLLTWNLDNEGSRKEVVSSLEEVSSVPYWDSNLRTLTFQGKVIKKYRVPAENQELILSVFEECGWPTSIDDPLPQAGEVNPKRRLHNAINGLNRNRKYDLIKFHGNGNGESIYWERKTSEI